MLRKLLDWLDDHHGIRIGFAWAVTVAALILLALFLIPCARAADAQLSWTNPTSNEDGTSIPASGPTALAQTRIEYGTCSGTAFGTKSGEVIALAPATTATVVGLAPGSWCFRAFSKNNLGGESKASAVVSKLVPVPIPAPPVLAVPVIAGMLQTPVYSVAANGNMSTFVGFVDVGAPCSGPVLFTYRSKSFREVPRSAVKLWGSTSLRLAAPCGGG